MLLVLRSRIGRSVSLSSLAVLYPIPGDADQRGHDVQQKEERGEATNEKVTVAEVEVRKPREAPIEEVEEAVFSPALPLRHDATP